MIFKSNRFACIILMLPIAGFCSHRALSQWVTGIEEPFVSNVTYRDLDRLIELFDPDVETERELTRVFEDHQARFQSFVQENTPAYDRRTDLMYDEENDVVLEFGEGSLRVEKAMLPLAKKQAALDRAAIQGWGGLLAERDPDRWEQFERERRQRLARGIMWPPARADVALIAAELEMEDEQRELIQGLLEDYSVRRDAHVRSHLRLLTESFRNRWKRREKRLELSQESQVIFDHEVANGTDPLEAHERAAQVLAKFNVEEYRRNWREQEPTRQLRTLNLQYAHMVASLLEERSEELAALFRDAVRREMYPAAYRPQPAAKYVEIVLRLDLDDDVRRNAEEVMESYHFRDDRLGEAVVRAQDKVFLDRYHSPNGYPQSEMANQEREREAIDARAQLSDEIVEILFRMLTPAQQAAAPKPSPSPRVTSPQ